MIDGFLVSIARNIGFSVQTITESLQKILFKGFLLAKLKF